jgi:hypothetical protein
MADPDGGPSRARRYLLGQASEVEASDLELEYFADETAVDRIAAAEEDLIEDYLGDRLTPDECLQFERHYLASPDHRQRVGTIRRLMVATSRSGDSAPVKPTVSRHRPYQWLALAAALVAVVGTVWTFRPVRHERSALSENRPASPSAPERRSTQAVRPPTAATRVFALSLSPASVRGANDAPSLRIPQGTDVVALRLEGEGPSILNGRAVIRTVTGNDVWAGPATTATDLPAGVVAQVNIPPDRLSVDDYVVTLFGTDPAGVERERYRYFLRVRSR